jgi:hypothetical protein
LVDKIKITPDSLVVRDDNNNVTFSSDSIYLKTNASGRMSMGGWRRLPVFAGQYSASVSTYVPEDHKAYGHCMTFLGAPGVFVSQGDYLTGEKPFLEQLASTGQTTTNGGAEMNWYAYAFYAPANVTQWYMHAGPYQSSWTDSQTLNRLRHYLYGNEMKIFWRSYWNGYPDLPMGGYADVLYDHPVYMNYDGWEEVISGSVVMNYAKINGAIKPVSIEPNLDDIKEAYKLKGEGYYIIRYEPGYKNNPPSKCKAFTPIEGMEDNSYYTGRPVVRTHTSSASTERLAGNTLEEWAATTILSYEASYGSQYGYWFPVVLQSPMNISVAETP